MGAVRSLCSGRLYVWFSGLINNSGNKSSKFVLCVLEKFHRCVLSLYMVTGVFVFMVVLMSILRLAAP